MVAEDEQAKRDLVEFKNLKEELRNEPNDLRKLKLVLEDARKSHE